MDLNEKRKLVIAIIDSGIDINVSDLGRYVTKSTGFRINLEGYIIEDHQMRISNEHGTAVALIIKHLCSNIELISINILNEHLKTDGRVLLFALEKTLQLKPDIIHLSLGTTKWRYYHSLKRFVKYAKSKNILVVSAAHNDGKISFPAYLKDVIGVKALNPRDTDKVKFNNNFFYAPPTSQSIPGIEDLRVKEYVGTSISAAFVTGHIACLKSKLKLSGIDATRQYLMKVAKMSEL